MDFLLSIFFNPSFLIILPCFLQGQRLKKIRLTQSQNGIHQIVAKQSLVNPSRYLPFHIRPVFNKHILIIVVIHFLFYAIHPAIRENNGPVDAKRLVWPRLTVVYQGNAITKEALVDFLPKRQILALVGFME